MILILALHVAPLETPIYSDSGSSIYLLGGWTGSAQLSQLNSTQKLHGMLSQSSSSEHEQTNNLAASKSSSKTNDLTK